MVSVLASIAVNREFDKIVICCFTVEDAALRSKIKELLAQKQDNVSERATCRIQTVVSELQ